MGSHDVQRRLACHGHPDYGRPTSSTSAAPPRPPAPRAAPASTSASSCSKVTFDFNGNFHKYAIECLAYLSQTSYFAIHVWTLALPEPMAAMIQKLTNANIYVRGQNENASRKNVAWNTRKPWFDVLLDTTSGFDAGAGHWYWAQVLFQIAAESLSSTRSGATIIKSNERYAVNAQPHLTSPLAGEHSERHDRGPAQR